jgi:hypothetical protein
MATSRALGPPWSRDLLSPQRAHRLPDPPGSREWRDFQALHFDFGLPVHPQREQEVARYTALFVPRSACGVTAVTRLVSLRALLGQHGRPERTTLLRNLISYGESHGAWDDADGYSEAPWPGWLRRRRAHRDCQA